MAAIAGVGDDAVEHVSDERLHRRNDRGERVPVIRVAGQRGDMGDELTAPGMLHRRCDAHFHPELVGLVRLALADAFHLGRMQRIDFAAALAAVLQQHTLGEIKRPHEGLAQALLARDLATLTRPR